MSTRTTPAAGGATSGDYRTPEGLRALLIRLTDAGPGAWQRDPEAAGTMAFAAQKYASLARKHGLDPWEAASAAFEVMHTDAARNADNPWAMITHAVRITCIAEERAQGLLCAVQQARRAQFSVFHDAERLSDRESSLADYHPAFRTRDPASDDDAADDEEHGTGDGATSAMSAMEDAIALFTALGWPATSARPSIEHVCDALARAGSRHSTYETLRRDKHARALLDLTSTSWVALLRALLGHPAPAFAATNTGRGVLLRLLIGESLNALLHDDDLVLSIALAAPGRHNGGAS